MQQVQNDCRVKFIGNQYVCDRCNLYGDKKPKCLSGRELFLMQYDRLKRLNKCHN